MPCEPIKTPGGFGIMCSRGAPRRRCYHCKKVLNVAYQCDGPAPGRKSGTCDRYICGECSTPGDPMGDIDYCRDHASLGNIAGATP